LAIKPFHFLIPILINSKPIIDIMLNPKNMKKIISFCLPKIIAPGLALLKIINIQVVTP